MAQSYYGATNPFASASLYVGDLNPDVTEATLFEIFNPVGPVASIRVCRDVANRTSLGYAYVNFHSVAHAERALDTLNFTNIKGRPCRIMWAQRDKQLRETGAGNIFVKNLPESVDNKILYDTFSVFGPILSSKVVTDRETGTSRGYGYVHYLQPDDATKAIEGVHKMLISDKKIHAEKFIPRQKRLEKAPWTNVYIKHIPAKMTMEDLKKFAEDKTGAKINSSRLWEKPMFGKSACVNFETHEGAEKCVKLLDKFEMKEWMDEKENEGKPLKLYVARSQKRSERDRLLKMNETRNRGRPSTSASNNLYVKPLAPEITDEKLKELFSPFGEIISAKVMTNADTGQSRGFGFVCFTRKEDAGQALIKMNGHIIDGSKLYVNRAQKKQERQQFLANKARRASSRRMYGNDMMPPYHANAQMGAGYYSYPRPGGMPRQQQMHPAQFAQAQMVRPYPFGPMPQMSQVPIQMPMAAQMGMPMNPGQFPGFSSGMRVPPNAPFGMPQNVGMSMQQPPSNSAMAGAGGVPSATMRSGLPSVGATSQSAAGAGTAPRGPAGTQSAGQGMSARPGAGMGTAPGANYSQPTQTVGTAPTQHTLYASAGQTGVEPTGAPSRPMHSFPSQLSATERETQPLTSQMLQGATAQERKRMIGERLFPKIQEVEPRLAGKITGMLLEMENTELLVLLNNKDQLRKKINEALSVLKEHHKKQSQRNSESQVRQKTGSQGNVSQSNMQSNRQTSASNN